MSRITALELRMIDLPLVRPFRTSFGTESEKECLLVRIVTDSSEGWGECVASALPVFSAEYNRGAWCVIRDFLGPVLLEAEDVTIENVESLLAGVRGHPMAKATLVAALLDAELRAQGQSLAAHLGATREHVSVGVSVGIAATVEHLVEQVAAYVDAGYQRIKLKIEPGRDVERVAAVRAVFPDVPLSVDANAAYALSDIDVFRSLDQFGLLMIEQPLHHDDLIEHADLQSRITTPLCLDESIRSAADARAAIQLGACRIVNIKQGRVGGLLEARRIHDVCVAADVPVWCGGMLETGLGRAANLALAALPGFVLPGDISASSRYFSEDLTPPFVMEAGGTMAVPQGPGIGVRPRQDRLDACSIRHETLTTAV